MELLSTRTVPVALNLYKIRAARGAAGDFFRSAYKQVPQYQGLWVVAPDGKALGGQKTSMAAAPYKTWPARVLADLRAGVGAFGPVQPRMAVRRDPLPLRGRGTRPDGSIVLAVQDRLVIAKDLSRDPPPGALGPTVIDSAALSAEEWAGFAPSSVKTGAKWKLPQATARKLYPLLSVSDSTFRGPKEVTAARLAGRVTKVEAGVAHLAFEGELAATHHGTASEAKLGNKCSSEAKLLGGVGEYDVQAGKMLSLTLVFDGQWRNYAPYDKTTTRFGAVVEWRR